MSINSGTLPRQAYLGGNSRRVIDGVSCWRHTFQDSETMSDDEDAKIFPMRLMEVLQDGANSDSIRWLAHGRAFIIHNKKLFESGVMPKFFPRKSKYSSFTRKLNRWHV